MQIAKREGNRFGVFAFFYLQNLIPEERKGNRCNSATSWQINKLFANLENAHRVFDWLENICPFNLILTIFNVYIAFAGVQRMHLTYIN